MPESGQIIDKLIRTHIYPALRKDGFTRRNRTWNRNKDNFVDVINLQLSQWNTHKGGDFTLNLGVFVPSVYVLCWGKLPSSFIKEVDCIVRLRAGDILVNGSETKDHWWNFDYSTDATILGQELVRILTHNCIPELSRLHSLKDIHDYLANCTEWHCTLPLSRIYLAIIKAFIGQRDEAMDILFETGRENSAWLERANAVADRLIATS